MSTCADCGQDIIWACLDNGDQVALDGRDTIREGEQRYTITRWSNPPLVVPVTPHWQGESYVAHAAVCPVR